MLAQDETYLQPYDDALTRVQDELAHFKELTSDNPEQQARLAALEEKVALKLDELKRTVALMKGGDRPGVLNVVRSNTGKALMDDVRHDIAAMQQAEDELLRKRADESEASYHTTVLSIVLPAMIGIVLIGIVFSLSLQRQRAAAVLAEQKERLRTTLASIGDGFIATDTEGRITNMNAVAESLTGWTNVDAMARPLDDVLAS